MSDHSPSNACPKCGAALPSAATSGLCPRCLMAEAMTPTKLDTAPSSSAKMLTPAELAPHFPQLEIVECLGRGGMGVVYKARQKTLNRLVALKLLAPERVTDEKFAQRFTHEAQALAALNHPSIVTIYDFGQAGGFYYLLMEFVDGVNLRQAMKAGRFTPEQALAVVPPVCEALQYAHEHGIVHRDIKPENLLLDKEGRVKIADFGIAKILGAPVSEPATGDGEPNVPNQSSALPAQPTLASLAGTPQYMAPEQKAHRATDHRADIYSLGVVLYELLTGELPADKLQPPSRKVQIDVRLDEIVLRALEKSPELRYQTAGEFRTQVVTMTSGAGAASIPSAAGSTKSAATPETHFSTAAIIGAAWIPFVLAAAAFIWFEPHHDFPYRWNFIATFLSFLSLAGLFGTTILGWVAVSQIRRSAGRVHGMWLAVFDGLLFPLVALDAFVIGVVAVGLRNVLHLGAPVPNWVLSLLLLAGLGILAALIAVNVLIIRRVWRAVNRTAGNSTAAAPGAPGASVFAGIAFSFAVLSGILGSIAWVLLRQKSQLPEWLAVSILICALLGVVMGIAAWRHRLGKMAVTIGLINAAIWIVCAVFAPFIEQFSPTQARAAIEQALKQEIASHLSASSERAASLSVALDPNLKTAAVSIGGLQEMRGVEGRNEWVDVDGSLSVLNNGGNWIVQGDGALGSLKFTVPLADLTHTAQAYSDALTQKRSRTPKSVHVTRNGGTVLVHHDEVDLHYVIFAPKAVGTAVSDQYNTDSLAWRDHGSFKLTEQQTFGYDRESTDPFHLQINGKEYDLRHGRVLVPHDDGSVEQLKLFPPLDIARNPAELVKLIPPVRTMDEEPVTVEKLRWQLQAAEAQLHDVLKTCAPTHPFVIDVRESVQVLKKKIGELSGNPIGAVPTFGPVIEREIKAAIDLDTGREAAIPESAGQKPRSGDVASQVIGNTLNGVSWMEREGMDLVAHGPDCFLSGFGMRFIAQDNAQWDHLTAAQVVAVLAASDARHEAYARLVTEEKKTTLVFQTRQGGKGVLQFLGANDDDSVRIRYKLVQTTAGSPADATKGRAVLEPELQQARAVAAKKEAGLKAGIIGADECEAAKDEVRILEARLAGDELQVAELRLAAARRRLESSTAARVAGVLSAEEYEQAKGKVSVARAELHEARVKAKAYQPIPADAVLLMDSLQTITEKSAAHLDDPAALVALNDERLAKQKELRALIVGTEVEPLMDRVVEISAELSENGAVQDLARREALKKELKALEQKIWVTIHQAVPRTGELSVPVRYMEAAHAWELSLASHPEAKAALIRIDDPHNAIVLKADGPGVADLRKTLSEIDRRAASVVLNCTLVEVASGVEKEKGKIISRPVIHMLEGHPIPFTHDLADGRRIRFNVAVGKIIRAEADGPATFEFTGDVTETRFNKTGRADRKIPLPQVRTTAGEEVDFIHRIGPGAELRLFITPTLSAEPPLLLAMDAATVSVAPNPSPEEVLRLLETWGTRQFFPILNEKEKSGIPAAILGTAQDPAKLAGHNLTYSVPVWPVVEGDSVRFTVNVLARNLFATDDNGDKPRTEKHTVKLGAVEAFELRESEGNLRDVLIVRFTKVDADKPAMPRRMPDAPKPVAIVPGSPRRAAPAFGPVMESLLPFGAPCDRLMLQLRTGRLFVNGHGPGTTKEQGEADWRAIAEAGGVDAQAYALEDGLQLDGEGCVFLRTDKPGWDAITPTDVASFLEHGSMIGLLEIRQRKDLPVTAFFKTARGETGVLQVLDVVEDERGYHGDGQKGQGVKLRYRLVESGDAAKTGAGAALKPSREPRLQFRIVADASDAGSEVVGSHDGKQQFRLRREILLDDAAVADAKVGGAGQATQIDVTFTEAGGKRFAEITGANVGKQLAIVFDGKVLSAPTLQSAIPGGRAQITGNFTAEEAGAMAKALRPPAVGGAFKPIPPEAVTLMESMKDLTKSYGSRMADPGAMAAFEKEAAAKAKEMSGLLRGTEAEALMNRAEEITREFSDAAKSGDSERMNAVGKKGREIDEKLWALVHQAASKNAPPADPVPGIELKVAQQQLEKTLLELGEVQSALKSSLLEMKETHPKVIELRNKLGVLEKEAERLRALIRQSAPKQ